MKVGFTVTSVRKGHVSVDAAIGDVVQRVLVDGMEVDLTSDVGSRSLTLPFYGTAMEEAEKLFKPGNKVNFSVEGY